MATIVFMVYNTITLYKFVSMVFFTLITLYISTLFISNVRPSVSNTEVQSWRVDIQIHGHTTDDSWGVDIQVSVSNRDIRNMEG